MKPEQEMKVLLRAIERLRFELKDCKIDSNWHEYFDKFNRLNNLLSCLSNICWIIHGDRFEDEETRYETYSTTNKEIKIAN